MAQVNQLLHELLLVLTRPIVRIIVGGAGCCSVVQYARLRALQHVSHLALRKIGSGVAGGLPVDRGVDRRTGGVLDHAVVHIKAHLMVGLLAGALVSRRRLE